MIVVDVVNLFLQRLYFSERSFFFKIVIIYIDTIIYVSTTRAFFYKTILAKNHLKIEKKNVFFFHFALVENIRRELY